MTIRDANKNDLEQLTILFNQYRLFYRKTEDLEGAGKFLEERINQNDSEIFVAENESAELIGFVQLYPLFSSTRMKKYWLLNDLFVHENSRGLGASKLLIERSKQLVRDSAACGMYLETEKNNAIGNSLYPSAGFELYDGSNFYEWTNTNVKT